jgi:hypothetical protein
MASPSKNSNISLLIKSIIKFGCQLNRRLLYMPIHFSLQMTGAEMSVRMLLSLLAAVTQSAVALTDRTLTKDQLHTVLSVWTVSHRYFAPERPIVVSLPRTTPDVARSVLGDPVPQTGDL